MGGGQGWRQKEGGTKRNRASVWITSRMISSKTAKNKFFSKYFKNTSGGGLAKKDGYQI